ncbi:MAG: TIGR04197 family type VII secretion effector [Streptococcaceae bacterium]|nr:TIGR04197 family type VII secretion effector [Streptococcaceae bacterium]
MTGKIQSNTVEAQGAISELTGLKGMGSFKTVEFGESNITSMMSGKTLANELMKDISKITSCVLTQANKFPELAERIEARDKQDAKGWK